MRPDYRDFDIPLVRPADDAPKSATPISVSVAYGVEGLVALERDWRDLFEASGSGNYFVSYDWCKSWLDNFGTHAGSRAITITARRAGRLVAVLPLVVSRFGPLASAEMIGAASGQYCDMLIDADDESRAPIFAALWDGIAATGIDLLQFLNVRDDSALAALVAGRRTIQSDPIPSCVLDTSTFDSFDSYMKSRSSSLRKNMRRRRRRLEEAGPVSYEVITDPDRLDEVAATIIGHKLDWLDDRRSHGRFLSRKGVADWLADVGRRALEGGHLHLSVIKVDERIISAQVAFICGGRFTAYLSSFDIAFSSYAVGRMQYAAFIEDVFGQGLEIDLMPRHEEFKLEWVDHGVLTRSYAVPVTRSGSCLALVQNPRVRAVVRGAAKVAYTRLRGGGRQKPADSSRTDSSQADTTPRVEVTRDIDGIQAEWQDLWRRSTTDCYFLSFDWCRSWVDAFSNGSRVYPQIVTVRRGGKLVALLPLTVRRYGPLRWGEALGADTGQYCDMLVAGDAANDEAIYDAVWSGIRAAKIDAIRLPNVQDGSPLARLLGPHRSIQSEPMASHTLDPKKIEGGFEAYIQSKPAKRRRNLRRRRRNLEAIGPVVYETVTDPDAIADIVSESVSQKLAWLRSRRLPSPFLARKAVASWMTETARRALATGNLHLVALKVGERIVSAQLGFVCGGRFIGYFSSFDTEFATHAVGTMRVEAFLEEAFRNGWLIDLMPRHDEFKLDWVESGISTRDYAVPVTGLGSALVLVQNPHTRAVARDLVRFVYARLIPRKRKPEASSADTPQA